MGSLIFHNLGFFNGNSWIKHNIRHVVMISISKSAMPEESEEGFVIELLRDRWFHPNW